MKIEALPIEIEAFLQVRDKFYIDKTLIIKDVIDNFVPCLNINY